MYWAGFFNLIIHPREFFERLQNLWYRSTHSCTNIWIWGYFGLKNWTLCLAVPFSDVKTLKKHLFLLFFFMNCQWVFECARKQRGYFPFALSPLPFVLPFFVRMRLPRRLSKRLTSCYISTFRLGVHELKCLVSIRGLGWFIFLNTQVLLWDVAQERKKAMKKEALYGNFCIGIESTTALPWIPKMVSFIISIPALFHMGGSMYAMVVSFPYTFPLLLLPQRLLHFSHYNSVHNVTNA